MASPALTGLSTVTFNENTVNATPQIIDASVAFTDTDNNFNGGKLVVDGLLAQDTVSILNGLTVSASGGTVYYDADGAGAGAAVAIGTLVGGVGAKLIVTFNASATAPMIDALIENLTYANSSNTPTAARTLFVNVLDASGLSVGPAFSPVFTAQSGGANPLGAFDSGNDFVAPAMVDIDGDGDFDAVIGTAGGPLRYLENTGSRFAPVFTERTDALNPFSDAVFASIGSVTAPQFADLDGDGDMDLILGNSGDTLQYFKNTGSASEAAFTAQTGASNPFNGRSLGFYSAPSFGDLDGDGDLDMVVGESSGAFRYFRNNGTASAPNFAGLTGTNNPLNGFNLGSASRPALSFSTYDGGSWDLFVGRFDGGIGLIWGSVPQATPVFENSYTNPMTGYDVGSVRTPAMVGPDGGGGLELAVG